MPIGWDSLLHFMLARHDPEQFLDTAVSALAAGSECRALFDELPVPIYTTDREGKVTYWNRACIDFAGREPQLGPDRWCVTWQLYTTTGDPLAMKIARWPTRSGTSGRCASHRHRRASRRQPRAFKPYPTPLFDAAGAFTGAVNLLLDVTEEQSGRSRAGGALPPPRRRHLRPCDQQGAPRDGVRLRKYRRQFRAKELVQAPRLELDRRHFDPW